LSEGEVEGGGEGGEGGGRGVGGREGREEAEGVEGMEDQVLVEEEGGGRGGRGGGREGGREGGRVLATGVQEFQAEEKTLPSQERQSTGDFPLPPSLPPSVPPSLLEPRAERGSEGGREREEDLRAPPSLQGLEEDVEEEGQPPRVHHRPSPRLVVPHYLLHQEQPNEDHTAGQAPPPPSPSPSLREGRFRARDEGGEDEAEEVRDAVAVAAPEEGGTERREEVTVRIPPSVAVGERN
jgi:hypothetical protein